MPATFLRDGTLGLFAAAAACGVLAVWALALVFADLAMSRPRAAMAGWQHGAPMDDHEQRRRMLARIGGAVAAHPRDADQRMDLARFFAWHAARQPVGTPRRDFYARLAAGRFEEALRARPTWGYAWVQLAEQWSSLRERDRAVDAAIARASRLAPLEPGVLLKLVWLELGRWATLDAERRDRVGDAIRRLAGSPRWLPEVARIALHHDRESLLRAALDEPWQKEMLTRLLRGRPG